MASVVQLRFPEQPQLANISCQLRHPFLFVRHYSHNQPQTLLPLRLDNMETDPDDQFPHALTIDVPFPDMRYATTALKAIRVDSELSPLVRRNLITISPQKSYQQDSSHPDSQNSILRTEYKAATNRVLRVALNGFMESLSVVVGIMEELDVDSINAIMKISQDSLKGEDASSNKLSGNT